MVKKIINLARCYIRSKKIDLKKDSITHIDNVILPGTGGSSDSGSSGGTGGGTGGGSGGGGTGGGSGGGSGGGTNSPCSNLNYALTNPSECSNAIYLIIKPAIVDLTVGQTLHFETYLVDGNNELYMVRGLVYNVSDPNIGRITNDTGIFVALKEGTTIVSVRFMTLQATARVNVVPAEECTSNTRLYYLIALDVSEQMGLTYTDINFTRLSLAKELIYKGFEPSLTRPDYSLNELFKLSIFSNIATDITVPKPWAANLNGLDSVNVTTSNSSNLNELFSLFFKRDGSLLETMAPAKPNRLGLIIVTSGIFNTASLTSDLDWADRIKATGVRIVVICFSEPDIYGGNHVNVARRLASDGYFFDIKTSKDYLDAVNFLRRLRQYFCKGFVSIYDPTADSCVGEVNNLTLFNINKFFNHPTSLSYLAGVGHLNSFFPVYGFGIYLYLVESEIVTKYKIDFSRSTNDKPYILEIEVAGDKTAVDNAFSTLYVKVGDFKFETIVNWNYDFRKLIIPIAPTQPNSVFGSENLIIGTHGYHCNSTINSINEITPTNCKGYFNGTNNIRDVSIPGVFIREIRLVTDDNQELFFDDFLDEGKELCSGINVNGYSYNSSGGHGGYGINVNVGGINGTLVNDIESTPDDVTYDWWINLISGGSGGGASGGTGGGTGGGSGGGGTGTSIINKNCLSPDKYRENYLGILKESRAIWNDPYSNYFSNLAYGCNLSHYYLVKLPAGEIMIYREDPPNGTLSHYFFGYCPVLYQTYTVRGKVTVKSADGEVVDEFVTNFRGYKELFWNSSTYYNFLDGLRKLYAHATYKAYDRLIKEKDYAYIGRKWKIGDVVNIKFTHFVPPEIDADDPRWWECMPTTFCMICPYDNFYEGTSLADPKIIGDFVYGSINMPTTTGMHWNYHPVIEFPHRQIPINSVKGYNVYGVRGGFCGRTCSFDWDPIKNWCNINLRYLYFFSANFYEPKALQGMPLPAIDMVHSMFIKPVFISRIDVLDYPPRNYFVLVLDAILYSHVRVEIYTFLKEDPQRRFIDNILELEMFRSPALCLGQAYKNAEFDLRKYGHVISFDAGRIRDPEKHGFAIVFKNLDRSVLGGHDAIALGGASFLVGMGSD